MAIKDFPLGISHFQFSDLYDPVRLRELFDRFWQFAEQSQPGIRKRFDACQSTKTEESDCLIETARVLGDFIGKLFNVSNFEAKLKTSTLEITPIFRFKKEFLGTRVFKRLGEAPMAAADFKELDKKISTILSSDSHPSPPDTELAIAQKVLFLLDCETKLKAQKTLDTLENQRLQSLCLHLPGSTAAEKTFHSLQAFEQWCVQTWVDPTCRQKISDWASFVRAEKLDFNHLVETESPDPSIPEKKIGPSESLRLRDGFELTDPRMNTKQVLREIDYCIICHPRKKDSCSTGLRETNGTFKKNPLGISLEGCPLDERISEMHLLRRSGDVIASLAMIMLDNPMCPGTGHRICNDCMKGCIFQKQDPVNIPQNETAVLTDVLSLPYGFEIYCLLTRFNPLNRERPHALPYNGKNVLVVGLGPAGYTLSHFLANHGFGVIAIDGLKLEPIDSSLTGVGRPFPKPIQQWSELKRELDERVLTGFGGVSEYGITVRWDKNFLSVIYLSLLRRKNIRFYGGVRFGGTLELKDAWDLGFDHIAIATGAGRPNIIDLKNNLIRGIRKASDFLMGLQLTGAFKKNSLTNLQVRLPAVVIGGGLTAIDTATELLAYYPVQVEKILGRFETLAQQFGSNFAQALCDEEERGTLELFLEHGRKVREERRLAKQEKRKPNFIQLCRKWGGVSLVYRKKMIDSPAYRLNHEEVEKALEEGIQFVESMNPVEAHADRFGALEAITFQRENRECLRLPAKTVCVAAGTSPNTIYEREHPGSFELDEKKYFFKKYRVDKIGEAFKLVPASREDTEAFFLSHTHDGKFVSFYGDNHPNYAGNVVKAMASAKKGSRHVASLFQADISHAERGAPASDRFHQLVQHLDEALIPKVIRVDRLTPTIVEVIVKAHYAARKFEPGQFYRLQNYETLSHTIDNCRLMTEGMALTGAWVDKEKGLLSLIVLEMGASSRLCSTFRPEDPVIVMGPTGTPSEIPENQIVCLAGGGLGNAVLLSIAKALRARNNKVIYFAGYKKKEDLFKQTEIEESTNQVIWSVDQGEPIASRRQSDLSLVGNIVQAMEQYGQKKLQVSPLFPLNTVGYILAIGSDRMMAAVQKARRGVLKPYLRSDHVAIGSINSPMQCMMKEVCAQCLQRHVDPVTGQESFVFSCFNQDQPLDHVDFVNLNARLRQNTVQEKLTNVYLDYLFQKGNIERA